MQNEMMVLFPNLFILSFVTCSFISLNPRVHKSLMEILLSLKTLVSYFSGCSENS